MLFPNGTELRSPGSQPLYAARRLAIEAYMAIRPLLPTSSPQWNAEAVAKAARPRCFQEAAYVQYCHSPKHTVGEQLLEVRRDKRERTAFSAA
jgi:hypothetical protein